MTQLFGPPIEPRGSQKHRNLGAHRRSRPAPPRHSRAHNGAVSLGFTIAVEDATNKHSCGKPVNTTSVFGPLQFTVMRQVHPNTAPGWSAGQVRRSWMWTLFSLFESRFKERLVCPSVAGWNGARYRSAFPS